MQAFQSCLRAALTPFCVADTHSCNKDIADKAAGEKLQLLKSLTETHPVNLVMQKAGIIIFLPCHLKTNVLQHKPRHYVYI